MSVELERLAAFGVFFGLGLMRLIAAASRSVLPAVAIDAEIFRVQNRLERFALPFRKNEVGRFRQVQFLGFAAAVWAHSRYPVRIREKAGAWLSIVRCGIPALLATEPICGTDWLMT
jgi:hypothetical protein